jgi:hypothetical protein
VSRTPQAKVKKVVPLGGHRSEVIGARLVR